VLAPRKVANRLVLFAGYDACFVKLVDVKVVILLVD
jgi:hypothetical protein